MISVAASEVLYLLTLTGFLNAVELMIGNNLSSVITHSFEALVELTEFCCELLPILASDPGLPSLQLPREHVSLMEFCFVFIPSLMCPVELYFARAAFDRVFSICTEKIAV
jgi:hypothetical protein